MKRDDQKTKQTQKEKREKSQPKKKASDAMQIESFEDPAEVSKASAAATTVDSFFITGDGSNYMSTAVANETADDAHLSEAVNRRERRGNISINAKSTKRVELKYNKETDDDSSAHPSWAAKRKQKVIPQFQGKKVKFGEDEKGEEANSLSQKPNEEKEVLHPSWAAKQKLKPVITEFKGTKITFD